MSLKSDSRCEPFVRTLIALERKVPEVYILVFLIFVSSVEFFITPFKLANVWVCLALIVVYFLVFSKAFITSECFVAAVVFADKGSDALMFVEVSVKSIAFGCLVVTSRPRAVQRLLLPIATSYYPFLSFGSRFA